MVAASSARVVRNDGRVALMTFVVTENCIKCKYTDCVSVCPVDCFHEGANMLVIDPEECIDCALCVPECPVDAIFADEDVPQHQQHMIEQNAEFAPRWPVIAKVKAPPEDAADWDGVSDKYPEHFDPEPGPGN